MPPGLMTGGFHFASMCCFGKSKHMMQGGFRVDADSDKHIFPLRKCVLHSSSSLHTIFLPFRLPIS